MFYASAELRQLPWKELTKGWAKIPLTDVVPIICARLLALKPGYEHKQEELGGAVLITARKRNKQLGTWLLKPSRGGGFQFTSDCSAAILNGDNDARSDFFALQYEWIDAVNKHFLTGPYFELRNSYEREPGSASQPQTLPTRHGLKLTAGGATQGDFIKLYAAAIDGDAAALQQCDAICQGMGYGSFQEYEEKQQRRIAASRAHDEQPIPAMILTRLRQPEVANDPVLGLLLDMLPQDLERAVAENVKRPIRITSTNETSQGSKEDAAQQSFAELHPDLRKRRKAVLRLKRQHWTYREIALEAKTTVDVVKKDIAWLKAKALFP
jgi:hypothetical protein